MIVWTAIVLVTLGILAGILRVKLKLLPEWTEQRREVARRYRELFSSAGEGALSPYEPSWAKSAYHLYVVRVDDRERLQMHLAEAKIGTGIHYPIPLHLQKAYMGLGYTEGSFPVAERVAKEILSLPMFPGLESAQQSRVVEQVLDFAIQKAVGPPELMVLL